MILMLLIEVDLDVEVLNESSSEAQYLPLTGPSGQGEHYSFTKAETSKLNQ